jgi:hypothetical protein
LAVKIGENIKFQMSAAIMKGYAYFKNGIYASVPK